MTVETIPILSAEQWHAERAKDVTSTQVAALFGCNPYLTHLELWHQKATGYVEEFDNNDRVRWGNRLEAAIAAGVVEDWHLSDLRRVTDYRRMPSLRLGASFDFVAVDQDGAVALLEIKNVDAYEFREKWSGEGETLLAPAHIELQVQTQLMVNPVDYAVIAVLVGGNQLFTVKRERDTELQDEIARRVAAFWTSVANGTPPTPDYARDAELLLSHVYNRTDGHEVDAASDPELAEMVQEWLDAKGWSERLRPLQAEIAERVGTASKVRMPNGLLNCAANKNGVRSFRYYPNKETTNV